MRLPSTVYPNILLRNILCIIILLSLFVFFHWRIDTLVSDDLWNFWCKNNYNTYHFGQNHRNPYWVYFRSLNLRLYDMERSYVILFNLCFSSGITACLYYIYTKLFKLGFFVSSLSSLTPFLLPGNQDMFIFMDSSYAIVGFFFFLIYFVLSLKYTFTNNLYWLFFSLPFLHLSKNIFTENFLFLLFFSTLVIFYLYRFSKKTILLFTVNSFYALWFLVRNYLLGNLMVNKPTSISLTVMIERLKQLIACDLTIFQANHKFQFLFIIALSVIFTVGLFYVRKNKLILEIIVGGLLFFIITTFYCFISPRYFSRYAFIGSFGFNLSFYLSLQMIFNKFKRVKLLYPYKKNILFLVLLLLILNKGKSLKEYYSPILNFKNTVISSPELNNLPQNSQLLIITHNERINSHLLGGHFARAIGFFSQHLMRNDITGLIGSYSDTFRPFVNKLPLYIWSLKPMTGLIHKKPLFIYRYQPDKLTKITKIILNDNTNKESSLNFLNESGQIIFLKKINQEFIDKTIDQTNNLTKGNVLIINNNLTNARNF